MEKTPALIRFARWLGHHLLEKPYRARIYGVENIPNGGALLAANHASSMDGPLLFVMAPRTVSFLAKKELFKGPVLNRLFRNLAQIPVARGRGDAKALDEALEHLRKGGLIGIFPEGTTSPDGRLMKGHTGVARLHLGSGVPVVPVALLGTHEAMPRGSRLPRKGVLRVNVGLPIMFREHLGTGGADMSVNRAVTDDIMKVIGALMDIRCDERDYRQAVENAYRSCGMAPRVVGSLSSPAAPR